MPESFANHPYRKRKTILASGRGPPSEEPLRPGPAYRFGGSAAVSARRAATTRRFFRGIFDEPAENLMETNGAECPICFGLMEIERRDGSDWLMCPNGCPTEIEAPVRKPPLVETETRPGALRATAGGPRS